MRQYKYTELNDKNWLTQKYCAEKLSTLEIAKLVGAKTGNSVRQALNRFEIEIRDRSEAQVGKLEDYFVFNYDAICGSLLGDGSLKCHNKLNENSQAFFHKKNIHYDHIEFVAKQIFSQQHKDRITKSGNFLQYKNESKFHEYFLLRTLAKPELTVLHKKWYPKENSYIKIIPEDIEITPGLLLNMFLDDGSSYQRRKESSVKQVTISIHSQSFSRENQEMFCEKVNKKFNINLRTSRVKTGTGFLLKINQSKVGDFYNIIGPPPFESLAYKWK